jgi:hypothetical protein
MYGTLSHVGVRLLTVRRTFSKQQVETIGPSIL